MRIGAREVSLPTVLLVALAVAVLGTVIYGGLTSGAAFDPYNPGWEGLAEVRGEAEAAGVQVEPALEVDAYADADSTETLAIVTAPGRYTDSERATIRAFVEGGGTLVLAGRDPATMAPLLAELGVPIEVDGAPLRDERNYGASPDFPRVTSVAEHPLMAGEAGLELNHGSALEVGDGATPLAWSSAYAYLDYDDDGEPDATEELAARPVVGLADVGAGRVVAVSDPSVFINAMLENAANRAFVQRLVAGHETLLVDRTAGGVPPLTLAVVVVRALPLAGAALALLGLVGVAAWERGWLARPRGRADGLGLSRAAAMGVLADETPWLDEERREAAVVAYRRGRA